MNRAQIILPLAALTITLIAVALVHGRNHTRQYVYSRSETIGRELIRGTNSTFVVGLESNLKNKLGEFLNSPARVEKVLLGDEEFPIGNGSAFSRLYLVNERRERIAIRLRKDPEQDKFHILGYWTPQEIPQDSSR